LVEQSSQFFGTGMAAPLIAMPEIMMKNIELLQEKIQRQLFKW